ncbi:hypothetical protein FRC09_005978 [Ceratobasidium sp. 395]|nr:hypothetical protein FRC09_005978 [Ceratobasidium sp. 395]
MKPELAFTLFLTSLSLPANAYPGFATIRGRTVPLQSYPYPPTRRSSFVGPQLERRAAAPYNPSFPYLGARNGLPATGGGGIDVPAEGDDAHKFTAPGPNDIRGPCPGMNAAANHNFISHDGIVTFSELMDAQQNVYNVGYDLALFLATLEVVEGGDLITQKVSIGREATSQTAPPLLPPLGPEGGFNAHNKFEADVSLTRNDYYLSPINDNFNFNGTLFKYMTDYAQQTSHGLYDRQAMMAYTAERYRQSLADNGQFFYGPKAVILIGAATFLYELFPDHGIEGPPEFRWISSFFGARNDSSALGGFKYVPERIPDDWHNRRQPYTLALVVAEIVQFLIANPQYNIFGGNVGRGNFIPLNYGAIKNGKLGGDNPPTTKDVLCLLYQLATDSTPTSVDGLLQKTVGQPPAQL